ncbi:MAG: 50S ribosomal protein L1 [Chloroflexota bacterium]|nr:50S ribosomal protein L1 [Chloroflexota bacterium]
MATVGKRYSALEKQVEYDKIYALSDAVALVKTMATAKFDETIELHFRLGIDPRHSDQQVRSTVLLPHGLGKTVRVLVFAEGDEARAAETSGADYVAGEETITRIQKENWMEFDAALAVPAIMAKVSRIGRILGPRGLMPNPKAGTVVDASDLARAVRELKAGRLEFRNDKTGNVHVAVGKASFDVTRIQENAQAIFDALNRIKPAGVKGIYMKKVVLCSTMSPGVRIDLSTVTTGANASSGNAE